MLTMNFAFGVAGVERKNPMFEEIAERYIFGIASYFGHVLHSFSIVETVVAAVIRWCCWYWWTMWDSTH
jgi:hypothetical protein